MSKGGLVIQGGLDTTFSQTNPRRHPPLQIICVHHEDRNRDASQAEHIRDYHVDAVRKQRGCFGSVYYVASILYQVFFIFCSIRRCIVVPCFGRNIVHLGWWFDLVAVLYKERHRILISRFASTFGNESIGDTTHSSSSCPSP